MHDRLDRLFADMIRKPDARASLMAVEAPGVAWRGVAPGMAVDSPVFIASCTKMFTAALIAQRVEAGDFALDDPAYALLPSGLMEGLCVIDGHDHARAITVGHLLSQTSGLADYFEDHRRGQPSLSQRLAQGQDRFVTLDEKLAMTRALPARFVPGARGRAHYSDSNFALLGALLEHVCAAPFADLVAARICAPLGLRATWVYGPDTAARYGEIAPLYNRARVMALPAYLQCAQAEGGVVSTLDEMMRLLRGFMGGALFGQTMLARLLSGWNPVFFPMRYGMGVMKIAMPPILTLFRRVPPLFGHSGATGVVMYHCPARDLWVCGTTNQFARRSLPYGFLMRAVIAGR